MRFFEPTEKAFSLIETMIALGIVLLAVSLAASSFKSCGRSHKRIVAGESVEAEVSLLMSRIEKDFAHAATSNVSAPKGGFYLGLTLRQADGVAHTYQAQCRAGLPIPLPMASWKGDCFRAMACPGGSTAVLQAPGGDEFPRSLSSLSGGVVGYALCAQDLGSGALRIVIDAAVQVDQEQREPRIITKEKLLSRNAALGGEIQLLPKP